jgi:hypothetical protein
LIATRSFGLPFSSAATSKFLRDEDAPLTRPNTPYWPSRPGWSATDEKLRAAVRIAGTHDG